MNQSYQGSLAQKHAVDAACRAGIAAGDGFAGLLQLFSKWQDRLRQRRELAGLDSRALADLGIDRGAVLAEVEKPFWRP